uniref:Uncharacterized protein n=2 Tax=Anguilla anguilla TaxID=7936 RepID=A0A0E9TE81_ANGAN
MPCAYCRVSEPPLPWSHITVDAMAYVLLFASASWPLHSAFVRQLQPLCEDVRVV